MSYFPRDKHKGKDKIKEKYWMGISPRVTVNLKILCKKYYNL